MKRRRRKTSRLRRFLKLGVLAVALVSVEESVWAGLEAMGPEGRARIALGTAVVRAEMARYGTRFVGIEGLSWAEAVALRRRLGLGLSPGDGPGFLNVRFGTIQALGAGRYAIDARIEARWAKGHRLRESRIDLTVRDGSVKVVARHPLPSGKARYRKPGVLTSRWRQYP